MLDLDRFKTVNDTLVYDAGGELLKEVAGKIRHQVRESDTVARIGGDEFTVLLPEIASRQDAAQVAEKLIKALSTSFHLSGQNQHVCIGASVCIASYPADAQNVDTLIKLADAAMYNAKQDRNSFRFCGA